MCRKKGLMFERNQCTKKSRISFRKSKELSLNGSVYTQTCNQDVIAFLLPPLLPNLALFYPFPSLCSTCISPTPSFRLFSYSNSALPLPLPPTPTVPPLLSSRPLSPSSLCLSIRRRREAPQRGCGSFPLPPTPA